MKRFLPLAPALFCLGLLAGCGKSAAPDSASASAAPAKIKIGFLVKQPEEPWFQYEWKGADAAAAQHGFEVIKLGVADGEKTMSAIDNLAVAGARGFVICTPDVRLGPAIVAKAAQKGLKVFSIDDQFVGADGKFMTDVPYIGMSASAIGRTAGENLFQEMTRRGWSAAETGVCVITFEELDTARERTDNAIAALKAAGLPAERIFKAPQKTTDIPGSFDAANILLTQQPAIRRWLIAGMNDSAVLGAVRAMEGRGFGADHVIGVGINGTDCLDELRKPAPTGFHGSIFVSAPREGAKAAELLHAWIKDGVTPPLDTRESGVLITRANFESILKAEGILP